MKQQEIILTIGLPASGKSYWADEFVQKNPEYVILNRDDLRVMLQSRKRYSKFSKWRETLVTNIQVQGAIDALAMGKSVIISDTNLKAEYRKTWVKVAKEANVKYTLKMFTDTGLDVCLDRDKKREFPVGQRVIMRMFKQNQDEYWPKPVYNADLDDIWIFDVDGTLANMTTRGPFEWNKVGDDAPNMPVINLLKTIKKSGQKIVIMSGRDGSCKELTESWFNKYNIEYDAFYIRPAKDNRKDTLIKQELYNNHVKGKYNVAGVVDDRDQVIGLWRQLGLPTYQCNYGDF